MHVDNLVKMANQIGDFFESMPDPVEAEEGIATHIKKFWEPRMKQQLQQLLASAEASSLHPLVLEAMKA